MKGHQERRGRRQLPRTRGKFNYFFPSHKGKKRGKGGGGGGLALLARKKVAESLLFLKVVSYPLTEKEEGGKGGDPLLLWNVLREKKREKRALI